MAEGFMSVKLDEEMIDGILPEGEMNDVSDGILALNVWAIPHWDWVDYVEIGAVKISRRTAEYIIGRLRKIFPEESQKIMMLWLNYGWSINEELKDWRIHIDFSKIEYKEE